MIPSVLGALAIGTTMGLIGSGGSILTVPVLVYGLDHPEKIAIAESLGIVGLIAWVALLPHLKAGRIDPMGVLLFGVSGMFGTSLGARLSPYFTGQQQLLFFAGVMLASAYGMLRGFGDEGFGGGSGKESGGTGVEPRNDVGGGPDAGTGDRVASDRVAGEQAPDSVHPVVLGLMGFVIGILSGLVGVGGGFIIVPTLTLFGGLGMHGAIGTSLAIIALKSTIGFYDYLIVLGREGLEVDSATIVLFGAVGAAGSLAGNWMSNRLDPRSLRGLFGAFLLVMATYMLYQELG